MTAPSAAPGQAPGPTVLDALSLLAEVADDLLVKTTRDTHLAVSRRVHDLVGRATVGSAAPIGAAHHAIASLVYGGLGHGLRATSKGLDRVAATGVGPRLEDRREGRFLNAAVNGLIGDKLLRERPQLAIPMAVRRDGADVWPERAELERAFPTATGRVVVLLHGLCEDETCWGLHRERTGTTYPEALAAQGWTPVLLRANTGLSLRENGVALAALAQRLVDEWPVPVERVALVGHSLGGLVMRAAGAVAAATPSTPPPEGWRDWNELVTDVVTLGTPHLGSLVASGVGHGSRGLGVLPETAAFGRILDWRSVGVHDLVAGLAEDVAPLPHARYHLVSATLTASAQHPIGRAFGDLLVRPASAHGRGRRGRDLFPGADVMHVGRTDHFGLLNHPDVLARLREWLA